MASDAGFQGLVFGGVRDLTPCCLPLPCSQVPSISINELCDAPHPRHVLEIALQLHQSRLWSRKIAYTAGSRLDWQTDKPPLLLSGARGVQQHQRQGVALSFSLGAQAGCGKVHCFGKPFELHGLGSTIYYSCRSHATFLKFRYIIPQPLAGLLSYALQTPCWCGWTPPPICAVLLVPWCAVKEASISRLRGGFVLAVDELTAVLIRFTKSFGMKVLSKYKMIKIQLCTKKAVSLVFPLLAGKPMKLVKLWTRSQ